MGAAESVGSVARLAKGFTARAKRAASTLKAEYEAGKRGDDTPPEHIWATSREQLDGFLALLRSTVGSSGGASARDAELEHNADAGEGNTETEPQVAVDEVAGALGGVDWASVRSATAERTGDAAKAVKAMTDQVDWGKVQPVASQVSRALIAAVAAGQIPVGGRMGATVARAIANQSGLAQRVGDQLQRSTSAAPLPEEFRHAIEATSRPAEPFDAEPAEGDPAEGGPIDGGPASDTR